MSRLKPRPTKNNAEKKKGSRLGCPFLMFYVTAEAVTHKAYAWLRFDDRYDETEAVRADPESGAHRVNRREPIQ
jgi:hypothetical protein